MSKFHQYEKIRTRTATGDEAYRRGRRGNHIVEGRKVLGLGATQWVEINAWSDQAKADKEKERIIKKIQKRACP